MLVSTPAAVLTPLAQASDISWETVSVILVQRLCMGLPFLAPKCDFDGAPDTTRGGQRPTRSILSASQERALHSHGPPEIGVGSMKA